MMLYSVFCTHIHLVIYVYVYIYIFIFASCVCMFSCEDKDDEESVMPLQLAGLGYNGVVQSMLANMTLTLTKMADI